MDELSYLYTDLEKCMCEAENVVILIREGITELYFLFWKIAFSINLFCNYFYKVLNLIYIWISVLINTLRRP